MLKPTVLVEGLTFPEGPRWHDGRLYFVDHLDGLVNVLADDHTVTTLATLPHGASGMGWRPDGTHLVVSMHDKKLLSLNSLHASSAGQTTEVADLQTLAGGPLNDMTVTSDGRAYIGGFGSDLMAGEPLRPTSLLRVDPDGSVSVAAEDMIFPNGMALTPDGSTLIVAESFALRLTAFDVTPDGQLANRRVWAQFGPPLDLDFEVIVGSGVTIPDGIALDRDGAVWVASPTGDAALRVAEGGEILDKAPTGDQGSYAVALGGPDGHTLFVCANARLGQIQPRTDHVGKLLAFRVDVPAAT